MGNATNDVRCKRCGQHVEAMLKTDVFDYYHCKNCGSYACNAKASSKDEAAFISECLAVAFYITDMLVKKRRDYGPYNLKRFGEMGIVVRLGDKLDRLANLVIENKNPNYESVEDTWKDVIGYGILGLLEHRRRR